MGSVHLLFDTTLNGEAVSNISVQRVTVIEGSGSSSTRES